jgi:hypothetical protein
VDKLQRLQASSTVIKPYLLAVRSDKEGTFVSTSDILLWQQLQKGSGLHVALKEHCSMPSVEPALCGAREVASNRSDCHKLERRQHYVWS